MFITRNVPSSEEEDRPNVGASSEDIDEEPAAKKSPEIPQDVPESEDVVNVPEIVISTVIVSNENQDTEADARNDGESEEEAVFIEAEIVNKPSAVDVVRNLLSSVSDQMSPNASPRRSLWKSFFAEDTTRTVSPSKPSLLPVEPNVDNDSNNEDVPDADNSPHKSEDDECMDKTRNISASSSKNSSQDKLPSDSETGPEPEVSPEHPQTLNESSKSANKSSSAEKDITSGPSQ